jgi:hypothetical protein
MSFHPVELISGKDVVPPFSKGVEPLGSIGAPRFTGMAMPLCGLAFIIALFCSGAYAFFHYLVP